VAQATYGFALDLDRDGFFCQGVSINDALNIIPTPIRHEAITVAGVDATVTKLEQVTPYGNVVYRVETGVTGAAALTFGLNGSAFEIPTTGSSTAAVWVRAIGDAVELLVQIDGAGGSESTAFTPTADWTRYVTPTLNSSPDVCIQVIVNGATDAVVFEVTGFMVVNGITMPAAFNAGDLTNAYDQINAYIMGASWSNGMAHSYDEIAQPNRAVLTLNNSSGAFFQEKASAELVTNPGNPFSFTGDNPTSWNVEGESGSDPEVSEVGADEGHGGSGSGYINMYTTGAALRIRPLSFGATTGRRYKVVLDINKVTEGGIYVTNSTLLLGAVISPVVYNTPGVKTMYFTAKFPRVYIVADGAADVTIKSLSIKEVSQYADIGQGMPLRITASFGDDTHQQMYVGLISNIQIDPGLYSPRKVTLTADDMLLDLQRVNFEPMLQTDVRTDEVIQSIFDNIDVVYPPASNFWVLGVEGSSELGESAILFDNADMTDFDEGATTLEFAGDNADMGNGVSARSYLEQMVAAEMGGRFFWNTRTNKFTFHSRHRDLLNDTVWASLTEDDFEGGAYYFGDKIVNDLTVNYQKREAGSAGEVVWSADGAIQLAAGESKTLTVRYRDPDQNVARIGLLEGIKPLPGTDYYATRLSSGGGRRYTKQVSVGVVFGATSAEITLVNNRPDIAIYVHDLKLRGTPLRTFNRQVYQTADGTSYRDNRLRPQSFTLLAVSNEDDIQAYAGFYLSRFKDRIGRYATLDFIANKSDARMTRAIAATIGDRISLNDSQTGHDGDYIVVGEQHQITPGGEDTHRVTWVVKSIARESYWVLGVVGKSELGSTTRLAF
jgi:hypothetical protein